jgi:uncharacterized protein (TIGR02996 family)
VSALAAAKAALDAGRRTEALSSLLAAWRATRAPELAALVERLGAELAPTGKLPYGDPKAKLKDRLAAWIDAARAQDPTVLSPLLASLIDEKSAEAMQRLEALAGWDADPRIASTLAALVEKPPFQATSTRPFWKRAFETLRAHADPRARARLAAMDGRFLATLGGAASMAEVLEGMTRRTVAARDEQLPSLVRTLDDHERAQVAAIEAALATTAPAQRRDARAVSADELLAAVYANPDDDGARQVLADALQEIGDPRGEFIALQLSGPDGGDPKREKTLYKKHWKEWLGAAGKILKQDSIVFERGFLVEGVIHPRSNGDTRAAIGAPEWSTARRLRVNDGVPVFPPVDFETHPVLRGLRVYEGCSFPGAAAIATDSVPRPLEVLRVVRRYNDGLGGSSELPPKVARALSDAPALPHLRVLAIGGSVNGATLAEWSIVDRLEQLEFWDGWAALVPIQRRAPERLASLVLSTNSYNGLAEIRRSASGLDALTIRVGATANAWGYASMRLRQNVALLAGARLSTVRVPAAAATDEAFMAALRALDPGEIIFERNEDKDTR